MLIQPTSWTLLSLTSLADFHAQIFPHAHKNNKNNKQNNKYHSSIMLNASAYLLCSSYVDILCKVLAITAGCGYKGYHLVHKVGLKGSGSERPGGCGWRL